MLVSPTVALPNRSQAQPEGQATFTPRSQACRLHGQQRRPLTPAALSRAFPSHTLQEPTAQGQWSWAQALQWVGVLGLRVLLAVPRLMPPFLQTRQYASVFLDNASSSAVSVFGGSQFSAVLLGI